MILYGKIDHECLVLDVEFMRSWFNAMDWSTVYDCSGGEGGGEGCDEAEAADETAADQTAGGQKWRRWDAWICTEFQPFVPFFMKQTWEIYRGFFI